MGGGPESKTNTWNFVRKNSNFFKKIKCSKQPKKQNKLNFYFSFSGVPNVRGGWLGSDVWDKVPNKSVFLSPALRQKMMNRTSNDIVRSEKGGWGGEHMIKNC